MASLTGAQAGSTWERLQLLKHYVELSRSSEISTKHEAYQGLQGLLAEGFFLAYCYLPPTERRPVDNTACRIFYDTLVLSIEHGANYPKLSSYDFSTHSAIVRDLEALEAVPQFMIGTDDSGKLVVAKSLRKVKSCSSAFKRFKTLLPCNIKNPIFIEKLIQNYLQEANEAKEKGDIALEREKLKAVISLGEGVIDIGYFGIAPQLKDASARLGIDLKPDTAYIYTCHKIQAAISSPCYRVFENAFSIGADSEEIDRRRSNYLKKSCLLSEREGLETFIGYFRADFFKVYPAITALANKGDFQAQSSLLQLLEKELQKEGINKADKKHFAEHYNFLLNQQLLKQEDPKNLFKVYQYLTEKRQYVAAYPFTELHVAKGGKKVEHLANCKALGLGCARSIAEAVNLYAGIEKFTTDLGGFTYSLIMLSAYFKDNSDTLSHNRALATHLFSCSSLLGAEGEKVARKLIAESCELPFPDEAELTRVILSPLNTEKKILLPLFSYVSRELGATFRSEMFLVLNEMLTGEMTDSEKSGIITSKGILLYEGLSNLSHEDSRDFAFETLLPFKDSPEFDPYILGMLFSGRGDEEEALSLFKRSASIGNVSGAWDASILELKSGNRVEGERLCVQAARLMHPPAIGLDLFLQTSRGDCSIEAAMKQLYLEPTGEALLVFVQSCYMSNPEEVAAYLDEIVTLYPALEEKVSLFFKEIAKIEVQKAKDFTKAKKGDAAVVSKPVKMKVEEVEPTPKESSVKRGKALEGIHAALASGVRKLSASQLNTLLTSFQSQGRLKQGSGSRVKLSDPASGKTLSIHLPHGKSSREVRGEG